MTFRSWLLLGLIFPTLVHAESETIKPEAVKPEVVVEDPVGPVFMTTTSEKSDLTSKTETTPKKDAESGAALNPSSHAQEGCLGICKKYQEICSADSIYDAKDCREQWNACETGCLQL